ncbi:MAG: flagellar motor protein MotD [Methylophilaceae bacterium]|nr:MAG: flagellar motor protein MotD [Methylophilaceae bacterium]
MIRRDIEEDEDNHDRWLVSYADFITLLFAFFVVMYSVSSVNHGKYKELSTSINIAFSNKESTPETNKPTGTDSQAESQAKEPTEPPLPSSAPIQAQREEVDAMSHLGQGLSNQLSSLIKAGRARVIQNNRGLRIDIKDSVLFTAGSADLIETAKAILSEIATPLLMSNHAILVEGHTDNTPIYITNTAFFSSWELSAVRASSVVSMFNEVGINNTRLSALGYGPSQPISDNNTAEGRETNRHISIMVIYDSLNTNVGETIEIAPKQE